jgi:ubiquinone/menaquinone biosynthesis C-methylase UbiE
MTKNAQDFYNQGYAEGEYASGDYLQNKGSHSWVKSIVEKLRLEKSKCLEVGCGRGIMQDIVENYTGVDLSHVAGQHIHKRFVSASATHLPFQDNSFDVVWTINVLEHVPGPEQALCEIRRVIRPGGIAIISPAWYCRPWMADGYPVRPYSDFNFKGKLIKASIPVRNSVLFRSGYTFPRRAYHYLKWKLDPRPVPFYYGKLIPNYEKFWMSDSDAVNSMDPFDAFLWFYSRSDDCLNYKSVLRAFTMRTGGMIFRVNKAARADE